MLNQPSGQDAAVHVPSVAKPSNGPYLRQSAGLATVRQSHRQNGSVSLLHWVWIPAAAIVYQYYEPSFPRLEYIYTCQPSMDDLYTTLDHDIVLTVNATELESSGAWVNVSWSGVSDPKKKDWIGVYSPPIDNTIDPSYRAPVKYQVCLFN